MRATRLWPVAAMVLAGVLLVSAPSGQTEAQWRTELNEALSFGTDHLSLYQLTIEPETPYALLHKSGQIQIPDDDLAAGLYEVTQEMTEAAGLPAYEISNHARPGQESRHNLVYWRYGDYAGVGPGAHGRLALNGARTATAAITEDLDAGVGMILDDLAATGRADDTLVIFLSDNGRPFPGAKTNLYDPGLHLPLIVRAPGAAAAVNDAMVSWTEIGRAHV